MTSTNLSGYLKNEKHETNKILALLSAASVLRNENLLREILLFLKNKNIKKIKIYETLLQTYLFAGFPSALISLKIASEYFKINSKVIKNKKQNFEKIGEINCRLIYGSKYEKLINNINKFSPDLAKWLVAEGYGKVLSRKDLSIKDRELSIISILAALKFEDQLYSHINGAFRLKVKFKDIEEVIKNLDLLGNKNLKKFGMKVFIKFKKEKLKQPA